MKTLLLIPLALAVSGCATLSVAHTAGDIACRYESQTRAALHIAMLRASTIQDADARDAAYAAIRVSLAALDHCPE